MYVKVEKILSDELASCYAVKRITHGRNDFLLIASEVDAACYAYDLNHDLQRKVLWNDIGGTMTIVQVPNSMDFLATQKFYPGFNASKCQLIQGKFNGHDWDLVKVMDFPYLHRFDLIQLESTEIAFIGCTIANSKKTIDDWSDKGKVFVGHYRLDGSIVALQELPTRLNKNHGYFGNHLGGYSLITAEEGVFRLEYPESLSEEWSLEKVFGEETSDIVQVDYDGDGKLENIIIQGFHGDRFKIFSEDFKRVLYRYPTATPFGHALWAGKFLKENRVIFGWRDGSGDLIILTNHGQKVTSLIVDHQVSASNVLAFEKNGVNYLFSANNGTNEVALYQISEG